MRLRRKTNIQEKLAGMSGFVFTEPPLKSGGWGSLFGNDHAIHVEMGTGKGAFLTETAAANPEINFIGFERVADIIYEAGLKKEAEALANLFFVLDDAERLPFYFQAGQVERLYLNFSDPWPKKRHEKRRLTHSRFLELYKSILQENGEIHLKTDNPVFFEYSLLSLAEAGFSLRRISRDLHGADPEGRLLVAGKPILTEYERRFVLLGLPICRCEALKPSSIC